ncbi:MAG: rhodanese-like domain-containing protein, partial [Hyphomicrobiaceae bacterium]|nr:rhodanese-like domain-containing protein [Hyphomicrobiaceae bacterium]
ALAATLSVATDALADGQACLTDLERKIERSHAGVVSLTPQQFQALSRNDTEPPPLVLDAREAHEFDVSRIAGAVRVDPEMSASEFRARFAQSVANRNIVIYCSVGVRSSRLVARIERTAREFGAAGVFNLRGGIFAWHNYGIGLTAGDAAEDHVHPYSRSWTRYLDFPNYTRFGTTKQRE